MGRSTWSPLQVHLRQAVLAVVVAAVLPIVGCAGGEGEPASPSPETTSAAPPPGASFEGEAFTFERITDDVYHVMGTGNLTVGSNGAVIINESDVLLVDSHITPAAAWALLNELEAITDKPVRTVVNTHFHFDHAHGNQVFADDVEIIGHEFTREMLTSGGSKSGRAYDSFVGTLPQQIADLEARLESATGEDLERLERRLEITRNYKTASDSVVPVAPTATLAQRMRLYRGDREIQLLFFGRGHTGGDVVVYLPAERIVVTGDLMTGGLPYAGDGYLNEWADTLEELKALEFDMVLPGHGRAFGDRERIDQLQAFLRDAWVRIGAEHAAGTSAEDAANTVDMTDHVASYPNLTAPGISLQTVQRVYELLNDTSAR